MANKYYRAQIFGYDTADPAQDKVTNTVYFRVQDGELQTAADNQNLTVEIREAFSTGLATYMRGVNKVGVKLYDLEYPEPRTPIGYDLANVAKLEAGVREVALCLSFRGDLNVRRQRGRLFLGPFSASALAERPTQALRDSCLALATALKDAGGANIVWCVHSPTELQANGLAASFFPVETAWVDDAWDTQRSRGLPPTVRSTVTIAE